MSELKLPRPWRVAAVCPCFNRPQDLEVLLEDFARLDLRGITLWVTIVDNASTRPLSTLRQPEGLSVEFVRSEKNTGGSGGFNLGMSHILSGKGLSGRMGEPDFVWWVDSDARVGRRSLRALVGVLARKPRVGAVGAALGEVATGQIWEAGGIINRRDGMFSVAAAGDIDRRALVKCDYVAACCALVRTDAIRRTGLFPENFIYYDDIDWCVQMRRRTGYVCRATRRARAFHPPGSRRFSTWGRYYISRNGYSVMDLKGLGSLARLRRGLLEVRRAMAQSLMGIDELADLHIRGLEDAAAGRFEPIEPPALLKSLGMAPYGSMPEAIEAAIQRVGPGGTLYVHPFLQNDLPMLGSFRSALRRVEFKWPAGHRLWRHRSEGGHMLGDLAAAGWRALTGPSADVAIVKPGGWPTNWFRGRVLFQVTSDGFLLREVKAWPSIARAAGLAWRGLKVSLRLAIRSPGVRPLPPAPAWAPEGAPVAQVREAITT